MLEHNRIQAAILAAQFAREAGLPPGNKWEPPVTRHIAEELERLPYREVENQWRQRLGLKLPGVNHA
jgi:hypothetical protein